MRKTSKYIMIFLIVVGSMATLGAQEPVGLNVNPDYIFNKWVFSKMESNSEVLVYRNEAYFQFEDYEKYSRWRFEQDSDVFHNSFSKAGMVFVPNKPSNQFCNRGGKYAYKPSQRTQGKWKMGLINGEWVLTLNYFGAINGGRLRLESTRKYHIVHIERNKMILQKLENDI